MTQRHRLGEMSIKPCQIHWTQHPNIISRSILPSHSLRLMNGWIREVFGDGPLEVYSAEKMNNCLPVLRHKTYNDVYRVKIEPEPIIRQSSWHSCTRNSPSERFPLPILWLFSLFSRINGLQKNGELISYYALETLAERLPLHAHSGPDGPADVYSLSYLATILGC